ncbi:hypothetical protein ACNQ13_01465 [Mycoplasma sp. VS428]|uniref:hypothetical protein n=1 Tax=Mycoplasma sp. VS428 TaxID=3401684 RepID=UPI003AAEB401
MSVGKVELSIGLDVKSIDRTLKSMQKKFSNSINNIKNMFAAAKIGSYLFAGADKSIQEYMAKMRLAANLQEAGFGREASDRVFQLSDNFERLGYSADAANDAFTQFIISGKATSLQTVGIYLDKNTKSTLANASAQERLNYLLKNGNRLYNKQAREMPKGIANMVKMKKASEDLQKALGQAFLGTISNLIDMFGGLSRTLKFALVAFTAYRTAVVLGNVAMGVSKAIATGSVWVTAAALAQGAIALAGIGALIGGSVIAGNAIDSMDLDRTTLPENGPGAEGALNVNIVQDRYGTLSEVSRANGGSRKVQTNFGSGS